MAIDNEIDSGVLQERDSGSRRSVETGRFPSELTNSGAIRNHPGDFPDLRQGKPVVRWLLFPEWSSFRIGYFGQQVTSLCDFRPWPGTPECWHFSAVLPAKNRRYTKWSAPPSEDWRNLKISHTPSWKQSFESSNYCLATMICKCKANEITLGLQFQKVLQDSN